MSIAARRLALMGAGGSWPRWVPMDDLLAALARGLTKYASNPVLAKGTAGQWDDWGVRELSPVVDENGLVVTESDGIWGYYFGRDSEAGTFQIGLAKSTTNGLSWTRYGSNPVIAPSGVGWYESDIGQPSVVKQTNGTRVMMAAGFTSGGVQSVGCLTSSDGLVWADAGSKLALGDFLDGATAMAEIAVPSLIKRTSGDWLCLLECRKTGVTNGWRIFGATATDPTGTWTVLNAGQPLLSPTGAGWESVGVANPHFIENVAGQYLLAYNGIGSGGDQHWRVGFAYGTDLTSLTRYSGNPLLAKGASGQWDDLQTEADFLWKEPGTSTLRLLYHGFDDADGSMQVGLATA